MELLHVGHCIHKIRYPIVYDCDYVHLFVGCEPKFSTSRVIQIRKSIRAR